MMPATPLAELQAILTTDPALTGLVLRTWPGGAEVATPAGLRTAAVTGSTLRIGERITLRNGQATPRAMPARSARYVL